MAPRKLNLKPSDYVRGGTYDPATKTLTVDLNGGTFAHGGVEPDKVAGLEAAESHGKYFNQHIHGKHRYSRVK